MDPVDRLNNIIDLSIKNNSKDILDEYLSSITEPSEYLNGKLIQRLSKILKAKRDVKILQVSCVATCLHHFVPPVTDPQQWEKISEDASKLCSMLFLIAYSYIKEDTFIQVVVNIISEIALSVHNIVDDMLKFLLKDLLAASVCLANTKANRLLIMGLVGSLLSKSSRRIRTEEIPSILSYLNDLSNTLSDSEDYETQVPVVDILARCFLFIIKQRHKYIFTKCPEIREIFLKNGPYMNFDPKCRLFLNEMNEYLGEKRKVFSIPCLVVFADDSRLRKPTGSDFWVDYNLGSRSVSLYHQQPDTWELIVFPQEKVISAVVTDSLCQSKNGEQLEAVKVMLTIDPEENSGIPHIVKIYHRKEMFLKYKSVIQNIFIEKYKTSSRQSGICEIRTPVVKSHEEKERGGKTVEETPPVNIALPRGPENKVENVSSKSQSSGESEEDDDEEVGAGDSPFTRYIKEKRKEELESNSAPDIPQGDVSGVENNLGKANAKRKFTESDSEAITTKKIALGNTKSDHCDDKSLSRKSDHCDDESLGRSMFQESNRSSINSIDTAYRFGVGVKKGNKLENVLEINRISETNNNKKREDTPETSSKTKKVRLYSFEKSDARDIIFSSQDQSLSVEVPTYDLSKKRELVKIQPDVSRKNTSFSYITSRENVEKEKEAQKQLSLEEATAIQPSSSGGDHSEDNSDPMPHRLFEDLPIKRERDSKKFFKSTRARDPRLVKTTKIPQQEDNLRLESACERFDPLEMPEQLKCKNTYSRSKPKRPRRKRIQVLESESSDSDSQIVQPSQMKKESDKSIIKESPIKPGFADQIVVNDVSRRVTKEWSLSRLDAIRDNLFPLEMKIETAVDFIEPPMKPRKIMIEPLMNKLKKDRPNKKVRGITLDANKKKATRKINKTNKQPDKNEAEPKKAKEDILKKLSQDSVNYEKEEELGPIQDHEKEGRRDVRVMANESCSQFGHSSKIAKNTNKQITTEPPTQPRFLDHLINDSIDPTCDQNRNGCAIDNIDITLEMEIGSDLEESLMEPGEIVTKPPVNKGKNPVKVLKHKTTNFGKKKATIQKTKKSEPIEFKEDILKKLTKIIVNTVGVNHCKSESPTGNQDDEDLAGILGITDDQHIKELIHTKFNLKELVTFGRLMIQEVSEKTLRVVKIAKTERETFINSHYSNTESYCNELVKTHEQMGSVTSKLEEMKKLLNTTCLLHKGQAADVKRETAKIRAARVGLALEVRRNEQTQLSGISSIFTSLSSYLRKAALMFGRKDITKTDTK